MKKMKVEEAAEFFGVSKEAIHNRIRRGSIVSSIEDGVKYVHVDTEVKTAPRRTATAQKTAPNNDRYYKYLEEQNAKLQARVDTLESETRTLRDQKEQMLVEEKEKMERIYKEKDEQLKNILQTLSSKFMLNTPVAEAEPEIIEHEGETLLEAQIEEEVAEKKEDPIALKKYLKSREYSPKKIEKILKRLNKLDDDRLFKIGKKIYIDPARYEYSDLI